MPIPILVEVAYRGIRSIPFVVPVLKALPWLAAVFILKRYFGGTSNTSERLMHSKVVMITGGTSGIGAAVAQQLALRGAQIIILTQQPPSDPFLVDYIDDLRALTSNDLVYAEQVDLNSLQSIRLFATKWVDNVPPRRLDMIILCANTLKPKFADVQLTQDGIESNWGINFLANFHLLSILSPAIRAQPPDRDVRIIVGSCSSYIGGKINALKDTESPLPSGEEYGTSKLATMVFAQAFQMHLDAYHRPDKQPNNARVILVDPGFTRTPGMRRWLTMGSLWGLLVYLITWPVWWLVLKSPEMGAQSFLCAAMEGQLGQGAGGKLIKECKERQYLKSEVKNDKIAKELWEFSEKQIEAIEKKSAIKRATAKREAAESKEKSGSTIINSNNKKLPGSRRSRKE